MRHRCCAVLVNERTGSKALQRERDDERVWLTRGHGVRQHPPRALSGAR